MVGGGRGLLEAKPAIKRLLNLISETSPYIALIISFIKVLYKYFACLNIKVINSKF